MAERLFPKAQETWRRLNTRRVGLYDYGDGICIWKSGLQYDEELSPVLIATAIIKRLTPFHPWKLDEKSVEKTHPTILGGDFSSYIFR